MENERKSLVTVTKKLSSPDKQAGSHVVKLCRMPRYPTEGMHGSCWAIAEALDQCVSQEHHQYSGTILEEHHRSRRVAFLMVRRGLLLVTGPSPSTELLYIEHMRNLSSSPP